MAKFDVGKTATAVGIVGFAVGMGVWGMRGPKRGAMAGLGGYQMTYKQAEQEFCKEMLPSLKQQEAQWAGGGPWKPRMKDFSLRSQAWNDYTDGLMKDRSISRKQYDRWVSPYCV